ncbi:(2E,6E)-farnesyl diphosphate synthase [Edwardsiella anguillarum]|nr:(2E,6E)-farnesyl diphosphate synthase [Edwardsiella anguillarum]
MASFEQQMKTCRQRADAALIQALDTLPFADGPLVGAMRYGTLLGGKRLRPYLVYATGGLFGCSPTALDAPAAAVECIHAYSLLHDDLPAMDDDDLRRGQPTCHIKFGEAHAILAGDALQTPAFSILADGPMPGVADRDRLQMLSELAHASGVAGMCGGQALDLEAEGRHVALAALEQIHRHKTGALIRCAVRMGALAGGDAGRSALPALDRYAAAIGLAFRYRMTFWMWWATAAKPASARADQQLDKSTYPALLGLDQARQKAAMLLDEALQALAELEQCHNLDTQALKSLASFIVERDN